MKIKKCHVKPSNLASKVVVLSILLLNTALAQAQEASNIYLGKLNFLSDTKISGLKAITQHDGYTNQPYFFSEHELYYTQSVKKGDEEQMDTFVYNLLQQKHTNLTNSKESEYSPTPLPTRHGFSVIRVNQAGKQELWSYSKDGKTLEHLAPSIEPVGYQVWLNKHELLLFVLGEPHTLQRIDTTAPEAKGKVIDDKIGASLYRFQKSDWFLYTKQIEGAKAPMVKAYNATSEKVVEVGSLVEGSEYFSVASTGHLLTSDSKQLHHRRLTISGGKPSFKGIWGRVNLDIDGCQNGISRTAISDFGDRLALVCAGDKS